MLSYFLGQMAMTIYNQTFGPSSVLTILERYNQITEQAMSLSVFSAIVLTIKSLAAGISVLMYLTDLSGKVTEKSFNIEQFFKATLRLIVCYMFIMNSDVIVGYLMELGTDAAQNTVDPGAGFAFFNNGNNKTKLINGIAKMKITEILGYIVSSLLPWILSMIGEVILQIILISRILEIVVMTALSPLSISDIYREGTASPGINYMKKVFALGLQVAVIVMINVATQAIVLKVLEEASLNGQTITSYLVSTPLGEVFTKESIAKFITVLTGGNDTFKVLGIMLARVGLIWNSLPLCEELTGAR